MKCGGYIVLKSSDEQELKLLVICTDPCRGDICIKPTTPPYQWRHLCYFSCFDKARYLCNRHQQYLVLWYWPLGWYWYWYWNLTFSGIGSDNSEFLGIGIGIDIDNLAIPGFWFWYLLLHIAQRGEIKLKVDFFGVLSGNYCCKWKKSDVLAILLLPIKWFKLQSIGIDL